MNLIGALQKAGSFKIKITKLDYYTLPYATEIESVQYTSKSQEGFCRLLEGHIRIYQVNDVTNLFLYLHDNMHTGEVRFTQEGGYKHICVLILGSGCVIEFIKCQPELDLELKPFPVQSPDSHRQYPYSGYTRAAYTHKN